LAKSEWSFKTAVELSAALAARKVSAVELAEDAIDRIERHDAKINAICVRDFERGLAAARAADNSTAVLKLHSDLAKAHSRSLMRRR
jgi:amidase